MSQVTSNTLRRIAALKLPPDAMAEVLSIIADMQASEESRKEKQRNRKRQERDRHATNTVQSQDSPAEQQAIASGEDVQAQAPGFRAGYDNFAETEQKEIPPTPPKENTTTSKPSSEDLFEEARSSGTRARRKAHATATRLPEDWQPGDEGWAYALKIGLTEIQIRNQIEEFRDYWHARAGPDALKVSWPATWRRWCRKHLSDYADNGHGQHRNGGFKGDSAGGDSFATLATKAAQRARGFGQV